MDPLNCKPISLLSLISNVMEFIITVYTKYFLFSNNLNSDHQFGFGPGNSTLNMQFQLTQQWMEALNVRYEIKEVYRGSKLSGYLYIVTEIPLDGTTKYRISSDPPIKFMYR